MLKYTTSPYLWKSCGMLCVEHMIPQQDQMKYTTSYWSIYLMLLFYFFGGKQLWFLFQSLVRIPRILPIIALLLWQVGICKTMERMINRRLVWYLESHKLLTNVQCGFRSKRSTVDHLVRFETFCREAFIHNQHLVSVFFDLEKAYDTTWKYEIMKDLHGFGLRGRLPNFISNVLQDRSFKVRVGSTFSDSHPQEMGVPQGSILSVTLFSVKINSITQCLKPGVDCSLYVDDFQVCYRSSNMSIIERQLQLKLTTVFNSQRQRLSLYISARKEVSV